MESRLIEYDDDGTILEGYFVASEAAPRPLVLVAHDWTGRRQYAEDKANEMAERGYAAFALDMYGKGVFGRDGDVEFNTSLMSPLAGDRAKLRKRIRAALETGRAQPEVDGSSVAAIGYCFGGMCVLELARDGADVKGVVSVHGIFSPGDVGNASITAKVLCLHGHDDPMVPPEQVVAFEQEMTGADVDWQMHVYGQTTHAFTNPGANNPDFGTVFSERANRRADKATTDFFNELF